MSKAISILLECFFPQPSCSSSYSSDALTFFSSLIFKTNISEDDSALVLLFFLHEWLLRNPCHKSTLAKEAVIFFWRHTGVRLAKLSVMLLFLCLHYDTEILILSALSLLVVQPPSKNSVVAKDLWPVWAALSFLPREGQSESPYCYLFGNEHWRPGEQHGWRSHFNVYTLLCFLEGRSSPGHVSTIVLFVCQLNCAMWGLLWTPGKLENHQNIPKTYW